MRTKNIRCILQLIVINYLINFSLTVRHLHKNSLELTYLETKALRVGVELIGPFLI